MTTLLALLVLASALPARAQAPIQYTPEDIVWGKAQATLPPGAETAVLEGNPRGGGLFTLRVKLPKGARLAPHWHPADERATVLSGALRLGFGDVFDEVAARRFPAGSFYVTPAGKRHYVWAEEETTLQLTGLGPWGIYFVGEAEETASAPRGGSGEGAASLADIKAGRAAPGRYFVEAYVAAVGKCPPCPVGAQCEPCPPDHIALAESPGAERLMVLTKEAGRFQVGERYGLTLVLTTRRSVFGGQAFSVELGGRVAGE